MKKARVGERKQSDQKRYLWVEPPWGGEPIEVEDLRLEEISRCDPHAGFLFIGGWIIFLVITFLYAVYNYP